MTVKQTYKKVRELDGNKCRRCGSYNGVQVHHVIPRSKLGKHVVENLMCLCVTCHHGVHNGQLSMFSILDKLLKSKDFRWVEAYNYYEAIYEKRKGYVL
jgi:hypothetical protein